MSPLWNTSDMFSILIAFLYALQTATAIKLPSGLSQESYCVGCEAVAKELHNQLTARSAESLEVRVVDALEEICSDKYYKTHSLPVGKIVRACKNLLGEYDEDLEQILISHVRRDDAWKALEIRICHMLSRACLGIRDAKKKEDPLETQKYKDWEITIDKDARYSKPVAQPSYADESVERKDEL